MGFRDLVKNLLRPEAAGPDRTKLSGAGPMIAFSGVGKPKWTPRRYEALAEEGFRKNVIAYRCVMQVATACSAVPWLLYDDEGHEIDQHPLLDLLCHPNPLQDGVSFLESVYAYLQIAGNAYIEAVRPSDGGPPVELYVLRPDRMKVVPGATGLPQGYQYSVNGQTTSWPADPLTGASNILHLRRFHPLDDWYGLAPMEAAALSIDQHNAAGAWNQALLNQGARPSGALVFAPKDGPATLTDDQLRRLREEMGQLYEGSKNAGRPLILEGGLDWREMSLSPKDMDWMAGRNSAARDIALAFGVPAQLVGVPDQQTYANMAEARMAFYEETALPLLTRVIAGFDHWLTPMFDDGFVLDYDPDDISALATRRDAQWTKLQNAAFLSVNEKRTAAGYEPVDGGDSVPGTDAADSGAGDDTEDSGESDDPDPAAANDDSYGGYAGDYGASGGVFASPAPGGKFNPNHDPTNGQFTSGGGGDDGTDANSPGEYPTSSINSLSDAQKIVTDANGDSIGKNSQCASLVHALAPDLPPTPQWLPGDKVEGNTGIPVGTPISTFNFRGQEGTNGYGPPDQPTGATGESHTGIYLGQDSNGVSILNQWQGSNGPRISHISWSAWNQNSSEGGSRYYTIDY